MEYTRPELRAAFSSNDQTVRETDLAALDYEHQLVPLEPLEAAADVTAEQAAQLEWENLRDFPRARVVYSERPKFFAGSRVFSRAAQDLELARPAVAEALEAAHQTRRQGKVDHEGEKDRINPLNPELALAGCNWLLQEKLKDENHAPRLRNVTVQTKARLSEQVKRINARRQLAAAQDEVAQPVPVEQSVPSEPSEAEKELARYKIAARKGRDELVDRLRTEVPDAEPEACIRLLDCLEIAMDDEGRLYASAGKEFETEAEKQIQLYLRDPQQLMNFVTTQTYLAHYSDLAATSDGRHPYDLYLRASTEFTQRLLTHSYSMSEFSPATFHKWFAIIDQLSATPLDYHKAKVHGKAHTLPIRERAEVGYLAVFDRICCNSLERITESQPKKVTSKVYELASVGFRPDKELPLAFTLTCIKDFYTQNPFAAAVLNRQLLRITPDTTAVDLFETLFTLNNRQSLLADKPPIDSIIFNQNLGIKQLNRLDRLYPMPSYLQALRSYLYDDETEIHIKQRSREINSHLLAKMATVEGHAQTLLGRFFQLLSQETEEVPSGTIRLRAMKRLVER